MKRELKDVLKYYLGTGLKAEYKMKSESDFLVGGYYDEEGIMDIDGMIIDCINEFEYIKPLLLPMSCLTEPLEDGTVPIVELARIADRTFHSVIEFTENEDDKHIEVRYQSDIEESVECQFLVCYGDNFGFQANALMYKSKNGNLKDSINIPIDNQLSLFEYLFANHFDVWNLIESGVAMDKRGVK